VIDVIIDVIIDVMDMMDGAASASAAVEVALVYGTPFVGRQLPTEVAHDTLSFIATVMKMKATLDATTTLNASELYIRMLARLPSAIEEPGKLVFAIIRRSNPRSGDALPCYDTYFMPTVQQWDANLQQADLRAAPYVRLSDSAESGLSVWVENVFSVFTKTIRVHAVASVA
tara:strand:- start:1022 stop:1537 length:516 start_codon:yes stop_codon:yes gene_type:complete